jgi:hypothetical protein
MLTSLRFLLWWLNWMIQAVDTERIYVLNLCKKTNDSGKLGSLRVIDCLMSYTGCIFTHIRGNWCPNKLGMLLLDLFDQGWLCGWVLCKPNWCKICGLITATRCITTNMRYVSYLSQVFHLLKLKFLCLESLQINVGGSQQPHSFWLDECAHSSFASSAKVEVW